MGDIFDERGFMIIPDPRELRLRREAKESHRKVVVVKKVFCPNGHNLIWDYASFNGCPGIRLRVRRPGGDEGEVVLSPIFGDHTRLSIGVKLVDGEKVSVMCPYCGVEIPVLTKCDQCSQGEIRVLSLSEEFDVSDGIAFCDVVGCPSSYIVRAGDLISREYVEGAW